MKHCCEDKIEALRELRHRQGRILKLVLAVNAAMFAVEVVAGLASRSTALLGDSLDMFGDAAVYGVSLYALQRGPAWLAKASISKGILMALLSAVVLTEAAVEAFTRAVPPAETMGAVGALALAANVACFVLLRRHREDDVNMRSAWICSRNDIIANVSVIGAAIAVGIVDSWWPDVIVGTAIAGLFLWSALGVLRDGIDSLRNARTLVSPSHR